MYIRRYNAIPMVNIDAIASIIEITGKNNFTRCYGMSWCSEPGAKIQALVASLELSVKHSVQPETTQHLAFYRQ